MSINSINFKGTFCLYSLNSLAKSKREKISKKANAYQAVVDEVKFRDFIDETHISIDDKYDNNFKKFLKRNFIPYRYLNVKSRVTKDEIYDKIKIEPMDELYGYRVMEADVLALEKQFQKSKLYVPHKGKNGLNKDDAAKYEKFVRYLRTNNQIQPPLVCLYKDIDGKPRIEIEDGRHRFAVLRDMGFKKIPVVMTEQSYNTGKEMGIFK